MFFIIEGVILVLALEDKLYDQVGDDRPKEGEEHIKFIEGTEHEENQSDNDGESDTVEPPVRERIGERRFGGELMGDVGCNDKGGDS